MMQRFFKLLCLALLVAPSAALAAGPVNQSFFGITKTYHGQPNTEIPFPAGSSRDWIVCHYSEGCGGAFTGGNGYPRGSNCDPAVQNAGWVAASTTEPTKGVFYFTALDAVINDDIAHGRAPMHVFFGMNPRWMTGLSGSNACAGPPIDINDLDLHVTTLAQHLLGRVHRYEPWNEANTTLFYGGTVANLVTYSQHVHDLVLAVDPGAIITTPSWTGLTISNVISGPDYFKQFIDAGGATTFTEVNYHTYPSVTSALACGEKFCPEQMFQYYQWYKNVATYAGLPDAPHDDTEFDNSTNGAVQTDPNYVSILYLIASSLGVNQMLEYTSDECVNNIGYYGCLLGPTSGMNTGGLALQTVAAELMGVIWTSPIALQAGANQITSTMTGGTAGTVGGCTPTGTMPTGMAAFNGECANGVVLSYVGLFTVNGVQVNRFRLLGTDTVHAGTANIYFNALVGTSQYTWWSQMECMGLSPVVGNSSTNVWTNLQMADVTAGGGFLSSQGVINMTLTTARADTQCWTGLVSQMISATTGGVRPAMGFSFNQNQAIDQQIDIPLGPTFSKLVQGSTYQGDFIRQDGTTERVVWDLSSYTGSNSSRVTYSTPAQYNFQRGLDGVEYPIVSNSIVLSNSPVFLRAAKQPIFW